MSGTSKELRAVALKNYCYFFVCFKKVWKFSSHKRKRKYIYFYTQLLNYLQTHMLEIIFAGAEYFNEQEGISGYD